MPRPGTGIYFHIIDLLRYPWITEKRLKEAKETKADKTESNKESFIGRGDRLTVSQGSKLHCEKYKDYNRQWNGKLPGRSDCNARNLLLIRPVTLDPADRVELLLVSRLLPIFIRIVRAIFIILVIKLFLVERPNSRLINCSETAPCAHW